jgi:hypothetical protein
LNHLGSGGSSVIGRLTREGVDPEPHLLHLQALDPINRQQSTANPSQTKFNTLVVPKRVMPRLTGAPGLCWIRRRSGEIVIALRFTFKALGKRELSIRVASAVAVRGLPQKKRSEAYRVRLDRHVNEALAGVADRNDGEQWQFNHGPAVVALPDKCGRVHTPILE